MANVDSQLVREIADQVLAALGRQSSNAPASQAGQLSAEIHAPAGVCTGDYSKFTELSGQTGATKKQSCNCGCGGKNKQTQAAAASESANQANVLRGIITANQLRAAMGKDGKGVALIAENARLTPLAQDIAREKPSQLRRVAANASENKKTTEPGGTWVWWSEQQFAKLQGVVGKWPARLKRISAGRSGGELAQVVREVAGEVRNSHAAGAVLFVSNAAKAGCFVNRCTSLRAVVGTCSEAVKQGMQQVGANVLIVEVPYVEAKAIEAMVEMMTSRLPVVPGHVEQSLKELRRCE